jgi:hypothetical protein
VNLLSPASTSSASPKSHSTHQSGSTSPSHPSDTAHTSTDKSKDLSSVADEAEPRAKKSHSLKLPAFLRRKSANEQAPKHESLAKTATVDGLPPSHGAEGASIEKQTEQVGKMPLSPLGQEVIPEGPQSSV